MARKTDLTTELPGCHPDDKPITCIVCNGTAGDYVTVIDGLRKTDVCVWCVERIKQASASKDARQPQPALAWA